MKLQHGLFAFSLMAGALIFAPAMQATLLTPVNPGDCQGPGCVPANGTIQNTLLNNAGNPTGTKVADTGIVLVNGTNGFNQTVFQADFREVVYAEAGGTLDFYYQVQVLKATKAVAHPDIQHVVATDFSTWLTGIGTASKVSLLGNTGTVNAGNPVSDGLSSDGSEVSWSFKPPNGTGGGQTSFTLLVSTNALTFMPGSVSLIDSGVGSVVGFEPGPEPASIVLFGTVLALTGLIVRRRLATKS